MASNRLPPKKDVALTLLESSTVFMHLDPRLEQVRVPPWFKRQPQLVLQVGLNMPVPIPDLNLDEIGVSCTLSFNRSPFFCYVPWKAIYALVGEDGRGMVWPEDIPPEVAAQAQARAQGAAPRAHLRAVSADTSDESPQPAPAPAPAAAAPAPERKKRGRRKAAKNAGAQAAGSNQSKAPRPQPAKRPMLASVEAAKDSSPRSAGDASKKKRELPPYLRVVK